METERPNPDVLLAEVNAAAARERRGRLKIFFGASAGVGKTYAMLTAAHEQMRAGTDVVVGLLETHGRDGYRGVARGFAATAAADARCPGQHR